MNRTKILLISLGALLLFLLTFVDFPPQDRKVHEKSKLFYETTITGTLTNIGTLYHGTSVTVNNSAEKFLFYPYADKRLNDGKVFDNLAEKGDSIIKIAYSDSLILIKRGKKYFYKFEKYDK